MLTQQGADDGYSQIRRASEQIFHVPHASEPGARRQPARSRKRVSTVEPSGGAGAERLLRLVVADDHPAILDALAQFLISEEDIALVGRATDGAQALRLITERQPDVAILDIRMPKFGGIEILKKLTGSTTGPAIILFTGNPERGLLVESLDLGARGFLAKESPLIELIRAVRIVADGGTYIDPVLGGVLTSPLATEHLRALTIREREVLRLLADGLRNEQIGSRLFISPLTVRTHVKHAMEKLESDTRTQAVASALRHSLIS
jgi:DNA-binding NarL/FixJ family response regulator